MAARSYGPVTGEGYYRTTVYSIDTASEMVRVAYANSSTSNTGLVTGVRDFAVGKRGAVEASMVISNGSSSIDFDGAVFFGFRNADDDPVANDVTSFAGIYWSPLREESYFRAENINGPNYGYDPFGSGYNLTFYDWRLEWEITGPTEMTWRIYRNGVLGSTGTSAIPSYDRARFFLRASGWRLDVRIQGSPLIDAGVEVGYVDDTGALQTAEFLGWWDGSALQEAALLGYKGRFAVKGAEGYAG